jgi:hypothetical protein
VRARTYCESLRAFRADPGRHVRYQAERRRYRDTDTEACVAYRLGELAIERLLERLVKSLLDLREAKNREPERIDVPLVANQLDDLRGCHPC